MDIMVRGEASKYFKPEEVIIDLVFSNKDMKYDKVLEDGLKNVQDFIINVLEKLDLKKEYLKTNSFNISEQNVFDYKTNKRKFDGYLFRQTAHMRFDYDLKKMTKFMELVANLKNPAYYKLRFNVKDLDSCKNMVIDDAYNIAKSKAEAIAKAAGKNLKDCVKIDFRPFSERVTSDSTITSFGKQSGLSIGGVGDLAMAEKAMVRQEAQIIENTFTPEDVEITEEIYCLWITE